MNSANNTVIRSALDDIKYGHSTVEEAAARIDAVFEAALERALLDRGVDPAPPNAEQRMARDLRSLALATGAVRPGVGEAAPPRERRRYLDGGME